jgi:Flp pilus assembly protein protease CpaA
MTDTATLVPLAYAIAALGLVSAAGCDLTRRLIPNEASLAVACGGALLRVITPAAWPLWASFAASLTTLVALGLLAARHVVGPGDAKLIAAATLTVPLGGVLPLLISVALAGGALALVYLLGGWIIARNLTIERGRAPGGASASLLGQILTEEAVRMAARIPMPYGIGVCAGTFAYWLYEVR